MVNLDPLWCYPKPAQRPHPPILLGGECAGVVIAGEDEGREVIVPPVSGAYADLGGAKA